MVDEWANATKVITEVARESVKTSSFEKNEGLPPPPMDEGAFFATPTSMELSQICLSCFLLLPFGRFFDGMDDDGRNKVKKPRFVVLSILHGLRKLEFHCRVNFSCGPYYCGIRTKEAFERDIVDGHYKACLYTRIKISGIDREVMPSHRITDIAVVVVSFDPKPI
ncbi:unnamed protein product [Fraxinus pennsylvanica]|uniref:Uncharacterized protein n=1 Tax=Fraxinus pennsylvanica TaxID=56036 RepID=A0AAD1YYX8_9LAMI|nr:unnamed protein product [Fraxinus pennsylvanica]